MLHRTLDDPNRALLFLGKALELAEQLGDEESKASMLCNMGNVLMQVRSFERSAWVAYHSWCSASVCGVGGGACTCVALLHACLAEASRPQWSRLWQAGGWV